MLLRDLSGIYSLCRAQCCTQICRLRERHLLEARTAEVVASRRIQHVDKTLRSAKRIAAFKQRHHSCRAQLGRASDYSVFTRSHQCQVAAIGGNFETQADLLDQCGAERFMAVVTRPHVRRRRALAEVVQQRCKTYR